MSSPEENPSRERRSCPRFVCAISLSDALTATNLSLSGAELESPQLYKINDRVVLDFPVPDSDEKIEIEAIILRIIRDPENKKHRYGLIFSELNAHTLAILQRSITHLKKIHTPES